REAPTARTGEPVARIADESGKASARLFVRTAAHSSRPAPGTLARHPWTPDVRPERRDTHMSTNSYRQPVMPTIIFALMTVATATATIGLARPVHADDEIDFRSP